MKATKELFKANGLTFHSYEEVEKYAAEKGYRICNTTAIKVGKMIVHLIDLTSKNE